MIRTVVSTSAEGAKRYHIGSLSIGDYYAQGQECKGIWLGEGSRILGLTNDSSESLVMSEQFAAMADNINPLQGGPLTERTTGNRRVGWDINYHVPKSVSAAYELTLDPALFHAVRSSVRESMEQIQAEAKCRVRVNGASHDRVVGNLCWAEFIHHTARPIDGYADPHLHAHCFTFNAVWDDVEKKWKAAQLGDIKRDMPYFEACFHARLASKLVALGYTIERRGKGWEIASVPDSVVRLFSRRTAEIEAKAAELGIEDAERKSKLAATTRKRKDESYPLERLRKHWHNLLHDDVKSKFIGPANPTKGSFGKGIDQSAKDAIEFAISHCFERESVISERNFLRVAIRRSLGSVPFSEIEEAMKRDPRFIRGEKDGVTLLTTEEVLAEEDRMIAFAKYGRGTCEPLAPNHVIRDKRLNEQQRAAVMQALTSTDRVLSVWGGAGTGKTTLLTEFVNALYASRAIMRVENGPELVTLLAPTADAGRGVLQSEGFSNADTVAKFLTSKDRQEKARNGLLWVDEAGLLGSKTMAALYRVADRINARVFLSGDPSQHRAVERGSPLQLLAKYAGVQPVMVETIIRQKGLYKAAVKHLSTGDTDRAFDILEHKLGSVREMNEADGHHHIANDYATTIEWGRSALVVSPTHAEGARVTAAIRDELKRRGMVKGKGRLYDRLEDVRLTEGERSRADSYETGMVVQFHQNKIGFKAGQKYTVVGEIGGFVMLSNGLPLPLKAASQFNVYRRHRDATELCVGDSIRITVNGKSEGDWKSKDAKKKPHALNNGSVYKVKGFKRNGDIVLETGWVVSRDYDHFTHGYCTTSNASQGKTVDRVFVAQSANSFPATSAEQIYVSLSRARHECVIYTDDAEGLRQHIKRTTEPKFAVELSASRREAHEREQRALELARRLEEEQRRQWQTLNGPDKSRWKSERGLEHG